MVPLDSLERNIFLYNFIKSILLVFHYQLLFLQSGRFPDKMNWTGAQLDLASLSYPVFLKFETHIKI